MRLSSTPTKLLAVLALSATIYAQQITGQLSRAHDIPLKPNGLHGCVENIATLSVTWLVFTVLVVESVSGVVRFNE